MIHVTHFSDPGCPFAYSAYPALTALRWRYGDQLAWRHVMIGLTEDAAQYAERGYTALRMAQGNRRFRHLGMPFGRAPKPRVAATARACRTVVAVRLAQPDLEWTVFRALQFTQFTTALPLDSDEALLDALRRVPELTDPEEILATIDSPDVTGAYEADRAESRTAAGTPTEFQGKAADTDGAVRYTAPSLVFHFGEPLPGGRRLPEPRRLRRLHRQPRPDARAPRRAGGPRRPARRLPRGPDDRRGRRVPDADARQLRRPRGGRGPAARAGRRGPRPGGRRSATARCGCRRRAVRRARLGTPIRPAPRGVTG